MIRLAALTPDAPLPSDTLPRALHEYFAEELFQTAEPEVQAGLLRLAALPTLTPHLVELALGEHAILVCEEAIELGFVSREPDGDLSLHPLLTTFLNAKFRETHEARHYLPRVVRALIASGCWDDAFDIISRFSVDDLLPDLLENGLAALLEANRLRTLETWIQRAIHTGGDFPALDLADAEIALRRGEFDAGEARALQAARAYEEAGHPSASHAFALAGECAHLSVRPSDALLYHQRAEKLAQSSAHARRAVWGQFVVATQFETSNVHELLERYEDLSDGKPTNIIRLATGELVLANLTGDAERSLARAKRALPSLTRSDDAVVTTSFLYRFAYGHLLVARYADAFRWAEQAEDEVARVGLRFPRPHIAATQVAALIGLRQPKRTELALARLDDLVAELQDEFEAVNVTTLRARALLSTGRLGGGRRSHGRLEGGITACASGRDRCASRVGTRRTGRH